MMNGGYSVFSRGFTPTNTDTSVKPSGGAYVSLTSATSTCELLGLKRSAPTFNISLPRVGLTRRRTWRRVMVDRLGRPVVARRAVRLPAVLEAPLGGRRPSLGCRQAATAATRLRSADYGSISQAGGRGPVDGTGGG